MGEKVEINKGSITIAGQPNGESGQAPVEVQELAMIKQWHSESKKWREQYDKNWKTYYEAYFGKKKDSKKNPGKLNPNINIVRPAIQTIIPIMTDARPGFTVLPESPEDIDFVEMMSDTLEDLWENQSMPIKMVDIITEMCILDCSIMKTTWNADLDQGLGSVEYEPMDIRKIFVNKEAVDFDRKCKYVIEEIEKTVGEWKILFPKMANKIKADSADSDGEGKGNKSFQGSYNDGELTLVSPTDQDRNKDADTGAGSNLNDNSLATGWQVWYIDDALEEYVENEEDGSERKVLKKKYPNGHLTTLLPNQNLILQTEGNPYEGASFNPYTKFIDTIVPRCFYGEGEVSPLIPVQDMLDKTAQVIVEYMRLMANPIWVIDNDSGVKKGAISNKVGLILYKNKGSELRREFPESIPPYVFEWFNTLTRIGDSQSGVQEITQGRKPVGVTAAQALETLQEAAQTRIRLKDRNLENSLDQLARMTIDRVLQFQRGVRKQSIPSNTPNRPTFVEYELDTIPDETGAPIGYKMTKLVTEWQNGEYVKNPIQEAGTNMQTFNLDIESGTSMPFQKAKKAQKALELFDRGVIDAQEILESYEWPNKEEVLQRVKQQQQAQAEAEAQAQAQQQGMV